MQKEDGRGTTLSDDKVLVKVGDKTFPFYFFVLFFGHHIKSETSLFREISIELKTKEISSKLYRREGSLCRRTHLGEEGRSSEYLS